jgi:hypothetical protein
MLREHKCVVVRQPNFGPRRTHLHKTTCACARPAVRPILLLRPAAVVASRSKQQGCLLACCVCVDDADDLAAVRRGFSCQKALPPP